MKLLLATLLLAATSQAQNVIGEYSVSAATVSNAETGSREFVVIISPRAGYGGCSDVTGFHVTVRLPRVRGVDRVLTGSADRLPCQIEPLMVRIKLPEDAEVQSYFFAERHDGIQWPLTPTR